MTRIDWPLVAFAASSAVICAILGPKLVADWKRSHAPPTWSDSLPLSKGGDGMTLGNASILIWPDFTCQSASEYPTGEYFIGDDLKYHTRCALPSYVPETVTTSSNGTTVSGALMLRCDSPDLQSGEACSTHYLAPTVRK